METVESLKWLKEHNLYDLASRASFSIKKIFTPCLAVNNEKVLIVGDVGYENRNVAAVLSGAYFLAAEQLKLDTKLILQNVKSRGDVSDEEVVQSLSGLKAGNVIILNMSDKLGNIQELGKSFRRWVAKKNHRFVSAMSLGDLPTANTDLILNAIDVNYKPLQAHHEILRQKLEHAKEVHITTPAGTDLYYNKEGIKAIAADGNYTVPGTGGNLPAGEIYCPPNGRKVEGKVVIDGSSRTHDHTILIKKPIELTIENGDIVEVKGGEEAKQLENTLKWAASVAKNPGNLRRICELGIGLNPNASIIGAMIVDDKTLGTAHIGIGSNYWFGGSIYAIIHLDQVFKNPKIYLDGELLKI
ncbi:MAG TPA: aminopeptidase [Candidatus Nanoarchaeia archaeon]|nr:aminopeptidase [Candidatus Nanoarchaeia archaeon]